MAGYSDDAIETRRKFVEAWNKTMISIWQERIFRLKVVDTGALYHSPMSLPVMHDGRFFELSLTHTYLEYGLWQDLGTGRNTAIGNTHRVDEDGWDNKRKRRRWLSSPYYSSTMNLRDFLAESIGDEFVGIMADLDPEAQRLQTGYYRRKGLS